MSNTPLTSCEQDAWCDIAQAVRLRLTQQLEMLPAMLPSEAWALVNALQQTYWLSQNAQLYDKNLEDAQKRLFTD